MSPWEHNGIHIIVPLPPTLTMRGPAEGAGTLYCGAPRVSGLRLNAAEAGDPQSWGASSFPKPARQVCCFMTMYKEFIFLEGCQVSVYLEWKAGQLEIEWGQCLDSNLSQSKGCHRQPWRHRQRRMTIVFQWEPLKHLGVAILHGAPSFRVGPPARSCALRWPLPTQCE